MAPVSLNISCLLTYLRSPSKDSQICHVWFQKRSPSNFGIKPSLTLRYSSPENMLRPAPLDGQRRLEYILRRMRHRFCKPSVVVCNNFRNFILHKSLDLLSCLEGLTNHKRRQEAGVSSRMGSGVAHLRVAGARPDADFENACVQLAAGFRCLSNPSSPWKLCVIEFRASCLIL